MAASQVGAAGGTLAAAVLGIGTEASGATNARGTAGQMAHELANTGGNLTTLLLMIALILVVAGLLFVSLARRHGPPGSFRPARPA